MHYIRPNSTTKVFATDSGLIDESGKVRYPFIKGAYRIAEGVSYADSFGFQWNQFRRTQIDGEITASIQSQERLLAVTGWDKQDLADAEVLEVGCGAGRFTRAVLETTKAKLFSVDYSNAVEACYANNEKFGDRLQIFQASIYELPFAPRSFDRVFCFGVLQHTPDVERSLRCLCDMVKPGGELVVDFYPYKGWYTKVHAKYILRPLTKRLPQERLLGLIQDNVGWMTRATRFFDRVGVGKLVNRFIPVCDIRRTFPENLSEEELREWAVLDTFDMFSPAFDQPQRIADVAKRVAESGLNITYAGYVPLGLHGEVAVVKGVRPK